MKTKDLKLTSLTIALAVFFASQSTVLLWADNLDDPPVTEGDFTIAQNPWGGVTILRYAGTAEQVAIPATMRGLPVTEIAKGAFKRLGLSGITIPNRVTIIGESAFEANRLHNVVIPDSVTDIGPRAFENCNIRTVQLGRNLINIGEEAFADNEITELVLPDSLYGIEDSAFANNKIDKLTLPSSLAHIGRIAFENNSINRVDLPDSLRTIYGGAFRNNRLRALIIPEGVASLPNTYPPFEDNPLVTITIPHSLGSFAHAFEGLPIAGITLPDNVNEANLEQFGASFVECYTSHDKKAGTYVYDGSAWALDHEADPAFPALL